MTKDAFYFILKAFFLLRYLNFCPDFFVHVEKQLDKKAKVDVKTYDVTTCDTNDYKKHIATYLKK